MHVALSTIVNDIADSRLGEGGKHKHEEVSEDIARSEWLISHSLPESPNLGTVTVTV